MRLSFVGIVASNGSTSLGRPPGQSFKVGPGEIGVLLYDPDQRVIAMEFQSSGGTALRYNHNGSAHDGSSNGQSIHVFSLIADPATTFVCWLDTTRSRLSLPFTNVNYPLPPEISPRTISKQ